MAMLAVALPVLLAIWLAARQARQIEEARVLSYAQDVVSRGEALVKDVWPVLEALIAARAADPCSETNLALMRKLDLSSKYLHGIGYESQGRLICSSEGREATGVALGDVDWTTPAGVQVRIDVRFPFDTSTRHTVLERQGYVAILNEDLPLDATTTEKDVSLAEFDWTNGHIVVSRGFISPQWVHPPAQQQIKAAFLGSGYVVGIARSEHFPLAAIAALPTSYVDSQTRMAVRTLVPMGALTGFILALAVVRFGRSQTGLPAMLKAALKRGELFLLYQPIVNLKTQEWVGAEALLRWRRPGGEIIRPDVFIPAAEEAGLIERVTTCVLNLVRRDAAGLFALHPNFHLAINLTAADLRSEPILTQVGELATALGTRPGNLMIEINERGFIHHEPGSKILSRLRAQGIRVAIDDFGTGYSSLAYLERFELDYLKIDKLFVDTLNRMAPTSQVALHIIGMAKSLGLKMIAEGVETRTQADFLCQKGVHYAQGWLFAKPMAIEDIKRRLAQHQPAAMPEQVAEH